MGRVLRKRRSGAAARRLRRVWIAATLAASALLGCEKKVEAPALPPPEVLFSPVEQRDVATYSEWVGTIDGFVTAEIRPKVSGYVLSQHYRNGSVVKAGQLLFQIDPRQFKAAYDQAVANLAQAKAELTKSSQDVARYRPLAAKGAVSQQEL